MCRATLFFLFFFKFVGLATFSLIAIDQKKKYQRKSTIRFVRTRLGVCYNVLMGCLIIASNYITIPVVYDLEYLNKTAVTTTIGIVQGVLGSSIISVILLCYCLNQSIFVKFANYLIDIEDELYRLREPVNRKRIFITLSLAYSMEFTLIVTVVGTEYLAYESHPVSWLASVLPASIVGWLFIQYFSVLVLMHTIFANVNHIMQNVCASNTKDVYVNCVYRTRRIFVSSVRTQTLLQIRSIHGHLCDISDDISRFYSLPVLLGTILTFFSILYNAYYFFEPFMIDDLTFDLIVSLNVLLWVILLLYPLGLLTTEVTKLVREVEQTGSIVHVLLNYTLDRDTKAELELFSLQLLHQKVRFTANGYFSLDNTLFRSVLSSVTTYLVILIQFQMQGSPPTDGTTNCTSNIFGSED